MGKTITVMEKDGKKITTIKKGVKNNKNQKYSYINAVSPILELYGDIFNNVSQNREGCYSAEMYDRVNTLLVNDFNHSINNLEYLSKQSMRYLKRKDKSEKKKIFWYKFSRFFHGKINEEIENLIVKREKYNLEMALMFEDVISSEVRSRVEVSSSESDDSILDDEPDYAESSEDLMKGPDEHRILHGKIVELDNSISDTKASLEYHET